MEYFIRKYNLIRKTTNMEKEKKDAQIKIKAKLKGPDD